MIGLNLGIQTYISCHWIHCQPAEKKLLGMMPELDSDSPLIVRNVGMNGRYRFTKNKTVPKLYGRFHTSVTCVGVGNNQ